MQFSVKQLFSLQLSIFFYFHNKSSFYTLNANVSPFRQKHQPNAKILK